MDLHKARAGGVALPSPAELLNRMIVVVPKTLTMEDPFDMSKGAPPKSVPTITANVLYLDDVDGQTLDYGATEGKDNKPARLVQVRVQSPYLIENVVFSQQELVKSFTPFVNNGGAVGQITRNGKAYLFESPADSHPVWARAHAWFAAAEAARTLGRPMAMVAPIMLNQPVETPVVMAGAPANVAAFGAGAYGAPVAQPVAVGVTTATAPAQYAPPAPVASGIAKPAHVDIPEAVWAGMPLAAQAAVIAANPAPAGPNLDIPIAGMESAWPYLDPAARAKLYADAAAASAAI